MRAFVSESLTAESDSGSLKIVALSVSSMTSEICVNPIRRSKNA